MKKCKERYLYIFTIISLLLFFILIFKDARLQKLLFLQEHEFIQSELDEIAEYFSIVKSATDIFNPIVDNIDELYKVNITEFECTISEQNQSLNASAFVAKSYPEICRSVGSPAYSELLYALNLTKLMVNNTPSNSLKSIYFVSKKGFMISSYLTDAKFLDVREFEEKLFNRPYILNAERKPFIANRAFLITGPYADMVTNEDMLTFTTSIMKDDELIGYLNMDVSAASLMSEKCQECVFSHNKLAANNLSAQFFINEYETGLYFERDFSLFDIYKQGVVSNYLYMVFIILSLLFFYFRSVVSSEEDRNSEILNESYKDDLTQLLNRRGFNRSVGLKVEKGFTTVAIFDIDFFKHVNDTYGHIFGDYVLKELASILKKNTRENDIVCRFGGEEFIVILSTVDIDTATIILERIRHTVENYSFAMSTLRAGVTISCGAYIVETSKFSLSDKLKTELQLADNYLYKAKNSGRNKVLYEVIDTENA